MLDRARAFTSADLRDEKMISLGKLAAGLAHELNNPASAAARGAALLGDSLGELVEASHARGAANLSPKQLEPIESVRTSCMDPGRGSESPLERADREDALIEWLERHGADCDTAPALVDVGATAPMLDTLLDSVGTDVLAVALRWIAAESLARSLVSDVQKASARVHDLVGAVK
jgi:signal transduction histidine kinase